MRKETGLIWRARAQNLAGAVTAQVLHNMPPPTAAVFQKGWAMLSSSKATVGTALRRGLPFLAPK